MKAFASALALFVALTAQEVRVGGLEGNNAVFPSSPVTVIDWMRPASANGTAYEKEFYVYGSVTDNRTNDPNMRIGLD